MTIRRRVLVSGRVQGVFFRDTCRRVAEAAGVAGWARNLPDGHVEVALEGERDVVQGVIDWCRRGTDWAEVTDVEVIEEEPRGETGFRIR
jgi:acylphosphatase